jgi:peptidoglycan/LPS O-acetylase OafA/YrhL
LISIRYYLPGVFENNPFPKAVNGSLWTIPLEVRCYLALALLGVIGLTRAPVAMAIGTVLFGIYYFVFAPDPTNYLFHFGLYFFSGVCLDLFRRYWEGRSVALGSVICFLAVALFLFDAPRPAYLLLITSLSVWIGSRETPVLNRVGRFGDVSYGVYVYAFGVQQTVIWLVGKTLPFAAGLLIAAVITTLCAYLSWYLVERPALGLKARLK